MLLGAAAAAGVLATLPAAAAGENLPAYVRARAADADGAVDVAARNYALALAAQPGSEVVAIRAYREGLASGDLTLARQSAAVLDRAGVAPPDAALFAFADAVAGKRRDRAQAALQELADGPLDFLRPVLEAWLAFDARDRDAALQLGTLGGDALDRRYAAENHALILLASGRTAEGLAAVQAQLGSVREDPQLRWSAASLLAGRGRRDAAQALLAGDDPVLAPYRERLGRGAKGGARFGVARFFVRVASDLIADDTEPLAITLTRAALILDPDYARAYLPLADALSREGADGEARRALAAVPADSPFAREARSAEVAVLARADQDEAAVTAAQALSAAPGGSAADARQLGDLLTESSRFDDAAAAYALARQREGEAADWTLVLQHGAALEQAGRWDAALPILREAVRLAPEQPLALNYLGYAQVERGENLGPAVAMLEQAHRLAPQDPNIADSLGWGYFRQGAFARALPLLEEAAQAEEASGTVQEHLGDLLWRIGRRYEARYAWSAATLDADDAMQVRLSDKLARGLTGTAQ
ncbi:tetratricopeptide repeat protein [Sphingomonas sp. ac-8]|uniref:tetratricopeptide repeat protein n=1 Tax=Sphingomonas sp. ac-8 TaxID=3242977 RepID=UPI003A7F9562